MMGVVTSTTATELLAAIRNDESSCVEMTAAALERIEGAAGLGAWVAVGGVQALAEAARLDREGPGDRPLFGLPIGVKDVFDTEGLPTAYGSAGYAGRRPSADAAAVALLRRAGAIVVGKTASTEFASLGPTTVGNPAAPGRSPGGSSSGSAAAVAAGSVPIALGTQTAGSVIRPAAYCAVVGYKPTFGAISRAGVLTVSGTLDTVGLFASTVADVLLVARVLTAAHGGDPTARRTVPVALPDRLDGPPPRLGFARTAGWDRVEPEARAAMLAAVDELAARGATVTELALPPEHGAVLAAQQLIQLVETAQSLARDRSVLSDALGAQVDEGLRVAARDYWQARVAVAAGAGPCRAALEPFDAVLTPAATGVPPHPPGTGDPWFCRAWTALGTPCVAVPLAATAGGLPAGLQLVAPPGADAAVLRAAAWATS
jgi:Asp-tRNA(Asn)/Glu-tRNA(Gln) amidotransferase A subunit family amidase